MINSGVTLVKTIPLRRFEDAARFGVGLSPVFTVFQVDDQITSSPHIGGPTGDTRLMPDPAQTVALAASPGWALAPVDQLDQEGEPYPGCPRTFARRMLERLAGHGLELRGGFEIEFFLGHRATPGPDEADPTPAHTGPAYGAIALADVEPFATALIRAFEEQGTGVMQFHPEYSTGQLELSVPHGVGIAAADTHLVVRHTIRAVAREPRLRRIVRAGRLRRAGRQREPPAPEPVGSEGEEPVPGGTRPRGHDAPGRGVHGGGARGAPRAHRDHRAVGPELRATPTPSLERPLGVLGTREPRGGPPLRDRDGREPAGRREPRGQVHGPRREPLPRPRRRSSPPGSTGSTASCRCPSRCSDDPASIPARRRRSMGIRQLPDSLGAAIRELERSSMLREAMGDVLFDSFLATRRAERDVFEGQDPEDVVRAHRWRY